MEQFKRAKVVMLPTENIKNSVWLDDANYLLSNHFLIKQKPKGKFQHLYIISDDEIKEGDWFIDNITNKTVQLCHLIAGDILFNEKMAHFNKNELRKKIIATTDTSLQIRDKTTKHIGRKIITVTGNSNLHQPSQQFIEKYIESYNKGEVITDVLVEYENKFDGKEYVDEQDAYGYDKFKQVLKNKS